MAKKTNSRKLVRPKKGKVVAGVAAGIANYLDMDVTVVRFVWILLFVPGGIPGFALYVVMAFLMPPEE